MIVQILDLIIILLLAYFAYHRFKEQNFDGIFYILILVIIAILVLMFTKLFFFN